MKKPTIILILLSLPALAACPGHGQSCDSTDDCAPGLVCTGTGAGCYDDDDSAGDGDECTSTCILPSESANYSE